MANYTVRRLSPTDTELFRAIRLEGLKRHPAAFGASHAEEFLRPPEYFTARLSGNAVFGGFDDENRLQGIIGLGANPAPKKRHIGGIWGMYVRPAARGTGLARALMAAALAESGCYQSVRLSVGAANHPARRLYQSMGFEVWGLETAALKVDGELIDEVHMRRDRPSLVAPS